MSKPNFQQTSSDSFWGYYDNKSNKNAGEKDGNDNRKDQNQRKKVALELLKRNTKTLNDSKEIFQVKSRHRMDSGKDINNEGEILEIPATQSPPKETKKRSSDGASTSTESNNIQASGSAKKVLLSGFENKPLNRIKNQERKSFNQSMISSPSIMSSRKNCQANFNDVSLPAKPSTPKKKKAEAAFSVEDIFEEMKKSEMKMKENEIEILSKTVDVEPVAELSKTSSSSDLKTDDISSRLSPAKLFQPNPEWLGGINAQALRRLKENSVNFHTILDEMRKANEKILEFRRALAWNDIE